ncbi:MAG: TolC family protein [Desulfuromonadales bacterium]|nr:TolC family protein [Desulfuromonadales bacterium]
MSNFLKISITLVLAMILLQTTRLYAEEYVEGLSHWPELTLQRALERGLNKNLELRIETLNVPIGQESVIVEDANFDPVAEVFTSTQYQRTPATAALSENQFTRERRYEGEASLSKRFRFGLDGRLSARTSRVTNSSTFDDSTVVDLDPQYRSFLVLDLTQPLLRDFGTAVNTTDVRIAENRLQQATYRTLSRAQRLVADIEITYYEMAQAIQAYSYRIESRDLAQQLLAGNREKFDVGLIPISEVQEAETAVASRDEQVLAARQQVETVGNRLRDLLEINREDPMSREFLRTELLPGTDQVFPEMEEALPLALDSRPDLAQQRLEIASRDIRLKFDKNQTLPRLDLEGTLGANGLSGEERNLTIAGVGSGSNPYDGNYFDSVDSLAQGNGYEWFVGARFSYPLGNREAESTYRRSGMEKQQAIYSLKRLETTVETEVIEGLIAVKRSLERVKVAGRFESLAEKTLSQEMERLQEGLSDTFRILDFQDKVIDARIRKITALGDYNRGLADLYRATGTNLERLGIVYKVQNQETYDATK